jgi:ubiquitin-protein ligase
MTLKGIKRLRNDVALLPSRYQCVLDPELPEHITFQAENLQLELWLDDVSLYPSSHTAHCFPGSESGGDTLPTTLAPNLEPLRLAGEIAEMLARVESVIQTIPIFSGSSSPEEMTEVESEFDHGDDDEDEDELTQVWSDDWPARRLAFLKSNCNAVEESDFEILHDVSILDKPFEGYVWLRIPIYDMVDSNTFSQIEADAWGLSMDSSMWVIFAAGEDEKDFKVYVRQAEHGAHLRDIVVTKVHQPQAFRILENYVSRTIGTIKECSVLSVGLLLLERLQELPKYCSICGEKAVDIPSLKPFCCSNSLCQYQYMYVDLNSELEEALIREPSVVDLLIQLTYVAADADALSPYPDCLSGDDDTSIRDSSHICQLLNMLPNVDELRDMAQTSDGLLTGLMPLDPRLLPLLRWVVMSNTAHIQKLTRKEEMLAGLEKHWHQFKMIISTPQKEDIFQKHKTSFNGNVIFAFHGSPTYNWHSILRTGLHFKNVVHGRAYGHGIYHAFDLATSTGYAGFGLRHCSTKGPTRTWINVKKDIRSVVSVNEIVLDETKFVSTNPFLVVNDPEKVQTRYLILQVNEGKDAVLSEQDISQPRVPNVVYHDIPQAYRISSNAPFVRTGANIPLRSAIHIPKEPFHISQPPRTSNTPVEKLELPSYASSTTTKHLQKELRRILRAETAEDTSIYQIDRENLDNLYCWRAYLYNFRDLPLAQDLKRLGLSQIEVKIHYGPQYPHTPPFIRIVKPRFRQFSQGGGGHVTAGGSICMSALTMDDWSPAYSISQVLVLVHTALSSTEPFPARISDGGSYSIGEAMESYIRVATSHGWRVPDGWNTLFKE